MACTCDLYVGWICDSCGLLKGAVANNGGATTNNWARKTPVDILADINALLAHMYEPWPVVPDTILMPYRAFYPAPVRFRVSGKRGKRRLRSAIERERVRQLKGFQPRRSILHILNEDNKCRE